MWLMWAFLLGTGAGLLYDIFRPLRAHRGRAAGIILDIIFALACGISLFIFAMASDDCRLGLWQLTASLLGFLAYLYSLSRIFEPALNTVYEYLSCFKRKIKKILKKIQNSAKNLFKKM